MVFHLKGKIMKAFVVIIGVIWFLIFGIYIIDHADFINMFNFHETVPFDIFGLIWVIVGLLTIVPLSWLAQKGDQD